MEEYKELYNQKPGKHLWEHDLIALGMKERNVILDMAKLVSVGEVTLYCTFNI